MIRLGLRVVRGPNWIWQNQDGGEGHVGTVCEIGQSGTSHSPENTVVVNWDSGHRTNYRVGYQDQYDLIIVDNAQIGVRHSNIVCDGCSKGGVAGIIFKCSQCSNYHLCSFCYGSDIHDKEHSFVRYTTPSSQCVPVPPRKCSKRIQLIGIFTGAEVVRGPDWEWGNQDGAEGNSGRVVEIRGWDNESCRSVANVTWTTGSTNVYRIGHKGNIDLKYITPTSYGYYYKDHMPILGKAEEPQPLMSIVKQNLSVGDQVKVCVELEMLIKLQQGHGGWNPRMVEHLSKLGTIHRITEKGDIRVQYENCPNRWTFHPAALIKVTSYRVGDLVTILNDAAKVQLLQKGHGEWIDLMRYALGKLCKVIKVYSDGDLRIQQIDDGFEWTVNPRCVYLEKSTYVTTTERSNSMLDLSHTRIDRVLTPMSGLSGSSMTDKLVRASAQGHIDFVKQYLEDNPREIDVMSGGKCCIQVAAHQGFVELVEFLISKGADVNVVDKEGDSVLHYAAFGNQPEVIKMLLQNGADINFFNSSNCSALHICAHKKNSNCVRELLNFGADVNVQDSYGDTPLHDAIGKENFEIVELLCNAPNLDFTIKNNRGFNVLHHAALKGNLGAVLHILRLSSGLVDIKKDDGFSALHLAALNGHTLVVEALIKKGKAEIDIRNNRRQTPFLLAVSQGHLSTIELLVKLGCNVSAKDEDGDNAMHLCIIKRSNIQQVADPTCENCPGIYKIFIDMVHITQDRLLYTLLCFMAYVGCRIENNNKGVNIFEWIPNENLKQLIKGYQQTRTNSQKAIGSSPSNVSSELILDEQILNNSQHTNSERGNIETSTFEIVSNNNESNDSAKGFEEIQNLSIKTNILSISKNSQECVVCNEVIALITFEPCQHQISCEDCGRRMKKCLHCGKNIERRVDLSGAIIENNLNPAKPASSDRLRYLENKIQEYEESHYCSICMERIRDVAFLCGHGACSRCAETLRTCHMCRKTISRKINLY